MKKSQLRRLRERWYWIAAGLVLGLLAGAAYTMVQKPTYAATLTVYISSRDTSGDTFSAYQGSLLSEQRVKSYAQIVTSPQVVAQVADTLQLPAAETADLKDRLVAVAEPDTVLLTITAMDRTPEKATRLADTVGQVLVTTVADLERPEVVAAPAPTPATTERRGGAAEATSQPAPVPAVAPVSARVMAGATTTGKPVSPNWVLNLWLLGVMGGLLGVGLASLRAALDTTVKDAADLQRLAGAANVGTIVYNGSSAKQPLVVRFKPQSAHAEAFRQLRTNLQFIDLDQAHKVFVVSSAVAGEGKSTTVVNLAVALGSSGSRVIVVEADLRRPRAGNYLGLERQVGLTSVLTGRVSLGQAVQSWGGGTFDFLASGTLPPNPSEVLSSNQMTTLLDELRQRYDVVLLDAPPLLPVSDAAVIAAAADGAIIVCRYGKTTESQVQAAAAAVRRVSGRVLGTVLTMVPKRHEDTGGEYPSFAPASRAPAVPAPAAAPEPAHARPAGRERAVAEPSHARPADHQHGEQADDTERLERARREGVPAAGRLERARAEQHRVAVPNARTVNGTHRPGERPSPGIRSN